MAIYFANQIIIDLHVYKTYCIHKCTDESRPCHDGGTKTENIHKEHHPTDPVCTVKIGHSLHYHGSGSYSCVQGPNWCTAVDHLQSPRRRFL